MAAALGDGDFKAVGTGLVHYHGEFFGFEVDFDRVVEVVEQLVEFFWLAEVGELPVWVPCFLHVVVEGVVECDTGLCHTYQLKSWA